MVHIEKVPVLEKKEEAELLEEKTEEKENKDVSTAQKTVTLTKAMKKRLILSSTSSAKEKDTSGPKNKLTSDYKPAELENGKGKKKVQKVSLSENIDVIEIPGNRENADQDEEETGNQDEVIREDGRVRGKQRFNKVVKVPRAPLSESEGEGCKQQ